MTPAQEQETRMLFESLHDHIYRIRIEARLMDRTKILILLPEYYATNYREYIHVLRQSSAMVVTPEMLGERWGGMVSAEFEGYTISFTAPDNHCYVFYRDWHTLPPDKRSLVCFKLDAALTPLY